MSEDQWEEMPQQTGAFMSWAPNPGQRISGTVVAYSETDGTDYAGKPCPQLIMELAQDTYSVNKEGERFDYAAGDLVTLNLGLKNLRGQVRTAMTKIDIGDRMIIEFTDTLKTTNGTLKVFSVKVARRSANGAPQRQAQPAARDEAPPF